MIQIAPRTRPKPTSKDPVPRVALGALNKLFRGGTLTPDEAKVCERRAEYGGRVFISRAAVRYMRQGNSTLGDIALSGTRNAELHLQRTLEKEKAKEQALANGLHQNTPEQEQRARQISDRLTNMPMLPTVPKKKGEDDTRSLGR